MKMCECCLASEDRKSHGSSSEKPNLNFQGEEMIPSREAYYGGLNIGYLELGGSVSGPHGIVMKEGE